MSRPATEVQAELERFGCRVKGNIAQDLAGVLLPTERVERALQVDIGWGYTDALVVATSERLFGFGNNTAGFQHVYWTDLAHAQLARDYEGGGLFFALTAGALRAK